MHEHPVHHSHDHHHHTEADHQHPVLVQFENSFEEQTNDIPAESDHITIPRVSFDKHIYVKNFTAKTSVLKLATKYSVFTDRPFKKVYAEIPTPPPRIVA